MKTTINISNERLEKAIQLTGARTKTEAVNRALETLIREQKIDRLIQHGR